MPPKLPVRSRSASLSSADALARLKRLHPRTIDLSLGRIERLLARLGHPEAALPPVIHVAGTNAKGSVVAFVRAILAAHGHAAHTYTSPHLVRFHERIVVAGREIDDAALTAVLEECEAANAGAPITFFEITTAAALLAFARTPASFTLLETGLGGRLDATNVVARPAVTAITPISLDHQSFLGTTLGAIAFEKAGILKPGVPCICARQAPEAAAVIAARAAAVGAPLLVEGGAWRVEPTATGFAFEGGGSRLALPTPALAGAHQVANAGLAIACLAAVPALALDRDRVARGLLDTRWPARLQRLTAGRLAALLPAGWELWLDGAHNPGAAGALARHLAGWNDRPTHLVFAMLKAKDAPRFLALLAPHVASVRTVAIPGEPASLGAAEAAQAAAAAGLAATPAASVTDALADLAAHPGGPARVLICGSLYLAGSVLAANAAG